MDFNSGLLNVLIKMIMLPFTMFMGETIRRNSNDG
ncbi:MAG: hypothetical protein ACI88L_000645 [Candidatus Paceibacteria bacterium]|jgi:hypothetical protein